MKYDDVNWRSGTASIYESEWSLARKYCYLNRVTINDIDENLLLLRQSYKKNRSRDENIELNERTLSRCLGESPSILRYRQIEHYLLPSLIAGDEQHWTPTHLRYCPLCMERGYHSPIYQLPWVVRCPIHGISLLERCKYCGNQIELKRWPNNWRTGAGVQAGWQVCCCDIWPGMRSSEWLPGLSKADTRPIGAYLKWLKSLTAAPETLLASAGLRAVLTGRLNLDTALEIFCIWLTLVPPPPAVKEFLIVPPAQISTPVSLNLPLTDEKTQSMINLIRNNGYHSIKACMAISYIYANKNGSWNFVFRRIVKFFAGHHRHCQHSKSLAKLDPLLSSSFLLNEECSDICHRLPFIEALTAKWIILWGMGEHLESALSEFFEPYPYQDIEHDLQEIDLLSLSTIIPTDIDNIDNEEVAELFRTASVWDPMIASLLERLLCYEALAIASTLIKTYHTYNSKDPVRDLRFCDDEIDPPRHPYVLAIHVPGQGLNVRIWPRHTPIVMPNNIDNAKDWHRIGIIDFLKWKMKWITGKKHRDMIEGLDLLRVFLDKRLAKAPGLFQAEEPIGKLE